MLINKVYFVLNFGNSTFKKCFFQSKGGEEHMLNKLEKQ